MNKELEERVRNNLGANVMIEYDEQGRKIGYQHIKLMKATEIIDLNKEVEQNKQSIVMENEKKTVYPHHFDSYPRFVAGILHQQKNSGHRN